VLSETGGHHRRPDKEHTQMNTRTIAILALVIAVIVVLALFVF